MIDTNTIKDRILSFAYQGRLVESNKLSNDAIEAIQESIKGYIPVSEEEYLIDIPKRWKWTRLGYVTSNHGQVTPSETFSYIDVGTLDNVNHRLSSHENIMEAKDAPSRAKKVVETGDVIYSTVRPYLHNICIIDKAFSCTPIASTAFCVMHANEEVLDNKYLFYWLLTKEFDKYSNGDPSKGALYPAIGEKDLLRGVIPLPAISEQKAIVEKIEAVFEILDKINVLQNQYDFNQEALKNKLIDAAIQGKLTEHMPEDGIAEDLFQQIQIEKNSLIKEKIIKKAKPLPEINNDEVPFDIPNNWKWVRWGSLSNQIQYGYNAPAQSSGRIKMVRITDIQNNTVKWETVPFCEISEDDIPDYLLHINDILFARSGATVGKSYLVESIEEDAVFAGYLIRTNFSNSLSAKYLKRFMESSLYWRQLTNGTTATAQPNCNAQTLSKMMVPLPPLAEQERIAKIIDDVFETINRAV